VPALTVFPPSAPEGGTPTTPAGRAASCLPFDRGGGRRPPRSNPLRGGGRWPPLRGRRPPARHIERVSPNTTTIVTASSPKRFLTARISQSPPGGPFYRHVGGHTHDRRKHNAQRSSCNLLSSTLPQGGQASRPGTLASAVRASRSLGEAGPLPSWRRPGLNAPTRAVLPAKPRLSPAPDALRLTAAFWRLPPPCLADGSTGHVRLTAALPPAGVRHAGGPAPCNSQYRTGPARSPALRSGKRESRKSERFAEYSDLSRFASLRFDSRLTAGLRCSRAL